VGGARVDGSVALGCIGGGDDGRRRGNDGGGGGGEVVVVVGREVAGCEQAENHWVVRDMP
jgi:hypothetical protein